MSGRQEGRARSSRAYAHDRTEHGRHSRTLRASVPDLSHVPRLCAGRPREVLRRVRLSPTGIGDASEAPHRAITLPTRSAEPRAQRERTLPVCCSPDGRTQRPLPTVRDAMAEKCRKVIVTAYNFQHGGWTTRPGEAGTPSNVAGRPPPAPPRPPDGPDALGAGHAKSPGRERG